MKHPDVQALVYSAFPKLRHCRYLLLRVVDADQARDWLRRALDLNLVKGGDELGDKVRFNESLSMAFTYAGLRVLQPDLEAEAEFPFPSAFQEGMTEPARSAALGDHHVDSWRWADRDSGAHKAVHVLLAHFRDHPFATGVGAGAGILAPAALQANGFAVVEQVDTCPSFIQHEAQGARIYEPFGFRDGLSQPFLREASRGTAADKQRRLLVGDELHEDTVVADGEFILGLPNEYGEPAYAPNAPRWPLRSQRPPRGRHFGSHGSYLAVRHIRQHADVFHAYDAAHPADDAGAPRAVEKMVGRRFDGRPLVTCPNVPPDADAFRYRVDDAEGFQCPLGSHVRRGNPRDTLAWDVESGRASAKLHRLIRRARVYTEGCAQAVYGRCGQHAGRGAHVEGANSSHAGPGGCGRGLFFIALNADFDRQFEFVQQRWVGNPRFADLANENDPLMGGTGRPDFTAQSVSGGQRFTRIPPFTQLLGGGYFFLPGLAALRFVAEPP